MKGNIFKKLAGLVGTLTIGSLVLTSCGGNESKPTEQDKPTEQTQTTQKSGHDPVTLESTTQKGKYLAHNFVDGKCTLCDETTIFTQDPVNKMTDITKACDKKGSVHEITYETRAYSAEKINNVEEIKITKKAYVYLPYGYNPEDTSTKYEVLYALHGMGLDEGYWFKRGQFASSAMDFRYPGGYFTENMLDNLMATGKVKKTIVVTPTFYPWDMNNTPEEYKKYGIASGTGELAQDFGVELTKDLMPYIASNYNTYASSSSEADLKANRDHQGFVGLSMGSMTSYSSILTYCLEYFAYIGSFSGSSFGEASWQKIIDNKKNLYPNCDIKYWFVGCGKLETESNYPGDPFAAYKYLKNGLGLQSGSDINNGDNCEFVYTNKSSHDYQTWSTCLYNSMLVFFQK